MATRYVWDKKTDGELQLWPSSSTERYITAPFLPTGDINTRNRKTIVTAPANLEIDSLARRGISAAARNAGKRNFPFSSNRRKVRRPAENEIFSFRPSCASAMGSAKTKF